MTTAILAIILLLVVAIVVVRKRSTKNGPQPGERRGSPGAGGDSTFHAVSLSMGVASCEAARNMAGRRFLSSAAPRIPLPECDVADCNCRFVHHADRRAGEDRRSSYTSQFGGVAAVQPGKDKRKNPERRDDPPDSFGF